MSFVLTASLTGAVVLVVLLSARPLARWIKKCRRRHGGVYAWRTRRHASLKREWGYVGETGSFRHRARQHLGSSNFAPGSNVRLAVAVKVPAQPWSDLDPVMYVIVRLPWWLCWKWVRRPLETLVILLLWPRYNEKKNGWNPRRITRNLAKRQRTARDRGAAAVRTGVTVTSWTARLTMSAGAALVVLGLAGWMMTR